MNSEDERDESFSNGNEDGEGMSGMWVGVGKILDDILSKV